MRFEDGQEDAREWRDIGAGLEREKVVAYLRKTVNDWGGAAERPIASRAADELADAIDLEEHLK